MKKNATVLIVVLLVCVLGVTVTHGADNANDATYSNRLIIVQGTILNAYFDEKYHEIKRAKIFYGYGWLDAHRVFVAYQPEGGAEASAIMEVVDVNLMKTYRLGEIGGTGESYFDINRQTKEVIYNTEEGISLMSINLNNLADYKKSHSIKRIKRFDLENEDSIGWAVFWINNDTVGYLNPRGTKFTRLNIKR